jgi:hypothetical protein
MEVEARTTAVGGRPAHVINAVLPTGEQKFEQSSATLCNPDLIRLGKRLVVLVADVAAFLCRATIRVRRRSARFVAFGPAARKFHFFAEQARATRLILERQKLQDFLEPGHPEHLNIKKPTGRRFSSQWLRQPEHDRASRDMMSATCSALASPQSLSRSLSSI